MQKDSQVEGIDVRMCCGWGKCKQLNDSALVFAANKTLWSVAWQGASLAFSCISRNGKCFYCGI